MAEEYKVSLSYDNAINVSLDSQLNNKVDSNFDISTTQLVAQTVEDLGNVNICIRQTRHHNRQVCFGLGRTDGSRLSGSLSGISGELC